MLNKMLSKKIKRIVARNTLLTYSDFNETFEIHTDDSAFRLGLVIRQKGKSIAFYSIKLDNYQQHYTVTEKELLSIVETLKYFRTCSIPCTLQLLEVAP